MLGSHVDPARVVIGQPFTVIVECEHDLGAAPRFATLDLEPLGPEQLWRQVGSRRLSTLPLEDTPGRALTRVSWSVVSLEPGSHELDLPPARFESSGILPIVNVPSTSIVVASELAEGEDQARELAGFREAPEQRKSPWKVLALAAGGLATALVLFVMVWVIGLWRKRRSLPRPRRQTISEILGALDPSDTQHGREAFALAVGAVRDAIDVHQRDDLSGCTDEEWIARREQSTTLSSEQLQRASELLTSAERVKYGMQQPTRWAVEECLASAQTVLEEVAQEETLS